MTSHHHLSFSAVEKSAVRIKDYILKTPLLTSDEINRDLGGDCRLFFKAENLQNIGAFKSRGAFNALLSAHERGIFPQTLISFSSGNHAQAVALAAKTFHIKAKIFMPRKASPLKIEKTRALGAEVVLFDNRREAEEKALQLAAAGDFLIPPYDHDDVILGQGTATYEAIRQLSDDYGVDDLQLVSAPCGGGGLLSGTMIAAKGFYPDIKVIGGEPLMANDAARSRREGKIFRWEEMPLTIADGARTLALSERTFFFIKQLAELYEISEEETSQGQLYLKEKLNMNNIEPTSALAFVAVRKYLQENRSVKKALVILSGGNIG